MISKRLTAVYIVFILMASIFPTISGSGGIPPAEASGFEPLFSGGSGTASDPYRISNVTELQWMGNTSNLNKHFILVNDINASGTVNWNSGTGFTPVGVNPNWPDYGTSFTGSFDGNNYTITGLYINRPSTNYLGLFGVVGTGGVIENVGLMNNDVIGLALVGGLVGYISGGTVSNCFATGNVSGSSSYVGGLVGSNEEGTVSNCFATGNVRGYSDYVGGLVGWNYRGTVSNCSATGSVSGTGDYVGGLVGFGSGTVSNCYATGNVSGAGNSVGGLVGFFEFGTVSNSFYNVDKVLINGAHHLTIGALYDTQYQDWFSNDMTLNISDYNDTLVPSSGYFDMKTVQGLRDLLGFVYFESYKFRLAADIDLSNVKGLYIPYFSAAEFDGNNNTIFNLQINISFGSHLGMFGHVTSSVKIWNVGIVNADVAGYSYVGGLVGWNEGTVLKSYATRNVSGSGGSVGGLVGYNRGTVSNCSATGTVSGSSWVSGLVGENYDGTVSSCYATGTVSGNWGVGGLVGWNFYATVSDCYATGTVSGSGDYVGGLVGENYDGTVSDCYATGNVSGSSGVGGFVGYNERGTVSNSYATGDITRSSGTNTDFGGFVGTNWWGKVINCYSTGRVIYNGATDPTDKGFCGSVYTGSEYEMRGNFWDNQTSKQTSTAGKAKGRYTTGMMAIKTFKDAGWEIVHVRDHVDELWYIDEGYDYPRLGWIPYQDTHRPSAIADQDQVINMGETAHFTASLSLDNIGIVSYNWTFTDGSPVILSGMLRSYRFDNAGIFIVTLNVTDEAGNWATDTLTVTVNDTEAPVANAGPDQVINMGETAHFNASLSTDNVGIVSYTWTFTDGSPVILSGLLQSHRFDNPGVFFVTLNITDAAGNWNIDTMIVTVLDIARPIADAGPDLIVDEDSIVIFNGSGSYDNVGIVNYTWTFMDGDQVVLYGISPEYIFSDPGIFIITLNVSDAAGYWNTDTVTVTVNDITPPLASAGEDLVIDEGELVTIDPGSSSDNVGIANWTWTFLDRISISLYGSQPEYQFNNPGVYIVTLNVSDAAGNWATATMKVTVRDITSPISNAGQDQRVSVGSTVILNGSLSTDNVGIVRYSWTFIYDGSERTIEGSEVEFKFDKAGTYEIELTVYDAYDNIGKDSVIIIVINTGIVKGIVLDDKGDTVEGAEVEITASNGEIRTATTGSDGSFFLEIHHGSFDWKITKDGYEPISGTGSVNAMEEMTLDLSDAPLVKEKKTGTNMLLLMILIIVIVLIILGIAIFLFTRKKEELSEEKEQGIGEGPPIENIQSEIPPGGSVTSAVMTAPGETILPEGSIPPEDPLSGGSPPEGSSQEDGGEMEQDPIVENGEGPVPEEEDPLSILDELVNTQKQDGDPGI